MVNFVVLILILGWMSSSFISFAVAIYTGIECREDDVEYGMNMLMLIDAVQDVKQWDWISYQ